MSQFIKAMDAVVGMDQNFVYGENGALAHRSSKDFGLDLFFSSVRGANNERISDLIQSVVSSVISPEDVADLFVQLFLTRDCRGNGCGKGEKSLFDRMFFLIYDAFPRITENLIHLIPQYGCYSDILRLLEAIPPLPASKDMNTPSIPELTSVPNHPKTKENKRKRGALTILNNDKQRCRKSFEAASSLRRITSSREMRTPDYYDNLRNALLDFFAKDLRKDKDELEKSSVDKKKYNLTLAGKFAPRADKHFATKSNKWIKKSIEERVFQNDPKSSEKYRRLLSSLSRALLIPEVFMCSQQFSRIDIKNIPSQCLKRHAKAFLNEVVGVPMPPRFEETGNRHPDNEDRVNCRKKLEEHLKSKKKIHGKQLQPHELVKALYEEGKSSRLIQKLYDSQWISIRESVIENISNNNQNSTKTATTTVSLGRIVPLSDVSGSMAGTPMMVSIALGILVSEVNHPAFRDRVLTFDEEPSWVQLQDCSSLADKIDVMRRAPWGGNTNLIKAFQQILDVIESANIPADEVPDLLIISDMQFDAAVGSESMTTLECIKQMFADYGNRVHDQPFPPPRIIFWNVRGDTMGFPATTDAENVQMLSGFSTAMLKCLLYEGELKVEEGGAESMDNEALPKNVISPLETYQKALADPAYDKVREALIGIEEGIFKGYTFHREVPAAIEKSDVLNAVTEDGDFVIVEDH